MRRFLSLLLFAALTVALPCNFVWAQGIVTGSISGTVQDTGKAVIPGAKVMAHEVSTGMEYSTVTNEVGFFTLRSVALGIYTVSIEAPKFEKLVTRDVIVNAGKDTALGARTLAVGSSSEVINVEGTAPLVDVQGAQITSTVDSKRIDAMPIGNGLDSIALFTPGVVSTGQGRFGNTNGPNISANGQRSRSNNFQIDGQANNDPSVTGPSIFLGNPDIVAEFQVVTNYGAEYGRNTGAVVNYVTKSGTNSLHGTAFEFLTPSTFDSLSNSEKSALLGFCLPGQASTTANPCTTPKVSRETDNRFGGTLGGPIVKNKAWFFGSYFEERDRSGSSPSVSTALTPTPAGLQTLISAFPNSKAIPFLNSVAPASISIGNPTFTGLTTKSVTDGTNSANVQFGKITRSATSLYNDREITGRVDYQFSAKDHVFGRYVYQKNITTVGSGTITTGAWVDVPGIDQQVGLDWVRTITNSITNQLRYSYSRANFGFQGGSFSNCTMGNLTVCPTSVAFRDGTLGMGLANTLPQGRVTNNSEVQDNGTWVNGRHTIKFGGEFARLRDPQVFLPNINGSYSFNDWSSFIQNKPFSLALTDGPPKIQFKENDLAFYVQDDFRLKTNLTLNAGLRWEMFGNSMNVLHDLSVARQTGSDPLWLTSAPLSATTVPEIPADKNNFGPVLGFAWTPHIFKSVFGEDKTVIRGGFRIAYDSSYQNIFLNVAGSTPFVNSSTMCAAAAGCGTTVVPTITLGSGFTGGDVRTANLGFMPRGVNPGLRDQTTVANNLHNPYSEQWNVGLQRYVTNKSAFEVRYVGSHTVSLYQSEIGNPYLKYFVDNGHPEWIPSGLTMCNDATEPGFGFADCSRKTVFERANTGWSRYDALQTRFDISNWRGVTFNFGYTYSRNLDNSSEVFNSAGIGQLAFNQNPFNANDPTDAGTSAVSFPNVATINLSYDLPWMKNQKGFVGKILGGWQWNTSYRYSSGEAFTPIQRRQVGVAGFCDPQSQLSTTTDACRPILNNSSAPFNSIAEIVTINGAYQLVDFGKYALGTSASGCGLTKDPALCTSAFVPMSAMANYFWVVNNPSAANFFGKTPWELGVKRNSFRGDTINNANMSMYKNTKLSERFNLQLQATAYNVLNRMYLGVPDNAFADYILGQPSVLPQFGTNNYNASGAGVVNRVYDGIGRRRMSFGAKLIF
jgi:hypothetical protein